MDSPSPTAYNNPIYSGEGDDSFYESGDNYLVSISTNHFCNVVCVPYRPILYMMVLMMNYDEL